MNHLTYKCSIGLLLSIAVVWVNAENSVSSEKTYYKLNNSNIEKALASPSSEAEYNTALKLKEMESRQIAVTQEAINVARTLCYSALVGNRNRSIMMVPLPHSSADLDELCHLQINNEWHAGGLAKGRLYNQDCIPLENDVYLGAHSYTSYVTKSDFEANRSRYPSCGPENALVCCSPQFIDN